MREIPPFKNEVPAKKFQIYNLSEIKPDRQNHWLIKNLLPSTGLGVLYGASGSGKSFLALRMGLAVAFGEGEFAGQKIKRTGGCIYLACEGGQGFCQRAYETAKKLDFIGDGYGFQIVVTPPNLGTQNGDKAMLIEAIKQACSPKKIKPSLFIFDTLNRASGGIDENSAGAMSILLGNVEAIGREFNALSLVLHHSGKNADHGMRGSSAIFASADTVIEVSGELPALKRAVLIKSKDGRDNLAFSFGLATEIVGHDEDNEPLTMNFIENIGELKQIEPPQKKPAASAPPSLKLWLDVFEQVLGESGKAVRPYKDGPEVHAIDREELRTAFYARRGDESLACKRTAFNRGLNGVLDRKLVFASVTTEGAILWKA